MSEFDRPHRDIVIGQAVGEFFAYGNDPNWPSFVQKYAEQLGESVEDIEADIRGRVVHRAKRIQANGEDNPDHKSRIGFNLVSDVIEMPDPDWIIPGILEADCIGCLMGADGIGKTFLLIDWLEHVGRGLDWCGKPTKKGPVAIIASEGRRNLDKRHMAWRLFHHVIGRPHLIHRSKGSAAFLELGEAEEWIEKMRLIEPVLVVIDTLNRNLGPGDESSTKDMTTMLHTMDRIRAATGAAVITAHHPGWGDQTRERGASAFFRGLDWRARLTDEGNKVGLTVFKMKDAECPAPMYLEKITQDVTETQSSLVLKHCPDFTPGTDDHAKATLLRSVKMHPSWGRTVRMKDLGMSERVVRAGMERLETAGMIKSEGNTRKTYQLTPKGEDWLRDWELGSELD